MAQATLTLYLKGIEFDVTVSGDVTEGGSNWYTSDEPPWIEVDRIEIYAPHGGSVSNRLRDRLLAEYGETIEERLCEAHREG